MKSVLITGGAGFIGSSVADTLLKRGVRVSILDNFMPYYPRALKADNVAMAVERGANLFDGDLTDAEVTDHAFGDAKPDLVIHLAACAGVRPSIQNPSLYAHTNVVGTQRILDACVKHGVERAVVASSSSVYGNNEKVPFAETDDVSRPISPYAATKVSTELVCRTMSHLHGISINALRFFTVFGPRQRPDLAIGRFLARIASGEQINMFGDGSTSRDYTYIDDIVDGVIRAAERAGSVEPFRVYNLGGEHPARLDELIAQCEATVGQKASINQMSEQPGDVRRTWADLTRSKAELEFESKVSLADGMARQWTWMQADPARIAASVGWK